MADTIRPATPADARAIAALVDRAYERYLPRMDRTPAPMLDDYDKLVADGVVTVFDEGGQVRGVLVAWVDGDSFYVDNLAVDPEAHGRGVGRTLLGVADELGRRAGCRRLWLYTNAAMSENLEYYPTERLHGIRPARRRGVRTGVLRTRPDRQLTGRARRRGPWDRGHRPGPLSSTAVRTSRLAPSRSRTWSSMLNETRT